MKGVKPGQGEKHGAEAIGWGKEMEALGPLQSHTHQKQTPQPYGKEDVAPEELGITVGDGGLSSVGSEAAQEQDD